MGNYDSKYLPRDNFNSVAEPPIYMTSLSTDCWPHVYYQKAEITYQYRGDVSPGVKTKYNKRKDKKASQFCHIVKGLLSKKYINENWKLGFKNLL